MFLRVLFFISISLSALAGPPQSLSLLGGFEPITMIDFYLRYGLQRNEILFVPEQSDLAEARIYNGRLVDAAGDRLQGQSSHDTFVINTDGRLLGETPPALEAVQDELAKAKYVFHSSFNGGGLLRMALSIGFRDGLIAKISNYSGHYRPKGYVRLQTLVLELLALELFTSDAIVGIYPGRDTLEMIKVKVSTFLALKLDDSWPIDKFVVEAAKIENHATTRAELLIMKKVLTGRISSDEREFLKGLSKTNLENLKRHIYKVQKRFEDIFMWPHEASMQQFAHDVEHELQLAETTWSYPQCRLAIGRTQLFENGRGFMIPKLEKPFR